MEPSVHSGYACAVAYPAPTKALGSAGYAYTKAYPHCEDLRE